MRFTRRRGTAGVLDEAIAMAGEGHSDAVHFLYARYADVVFGCVAPILREPAEAEDLVQAIFTELPTTIAAYPKHRVPFSAWLEQTARKAALGRQHHARLAGEALAARR